MEDSNNCAHFHNNVAKTFPVVNSLWNDNQNSHSVSELVGLDSCCWVLGAGEMETLLGILVSACLAFSFQTSWISSFTELNIMEGFVLTFQRS